MWVLCFGDCQLAGSYVAFAFFIESAEADLGCRHLIGHLSDHTLIATGNGGRDNTGLTRSLLERSICSISLGGITEGEEVAFRRCVTTEVTAAEETATATPAVMTTALRPRFLWPAAWRSERRDGYSEKVINESPGKKNLICLLHRSVINSLYPIVSLRGWIPNR